MPHDVLPMTPPHNLDTLIEMAYAAQKELGALTTEQVSLRHETGDQHKRLRETLIELADQLDATKVCQANMRLDLDRVKNQMAQPPDLTRSMLPTRLWMSVLAATIALAMTIVGAAYSVKSDVRDQSTLAQAESRLNDERIATLKQTMDDLKKDAALQRIQLESLTKMVIQQRRD